MKKLTSISFIIFLTSCATPVVDDIVYEEPIQSDYTKSVTFNESFDDVWDGVIDYATESFFAISSYEKDSGLMTLSFTSTPENYVDCGKWIVNGTVNDYVQFMRLRPGTSVTLNGIMNLRVVERSEGKTTLTSNARYILNITNSGFSYDLNYNRVPYSYSDTWTFDSRSIERLAISNPAAGTIPFRTCGPTGVAEQAILNGVSDLLE
tara:strand:- start:265 stop:885 length:621 start_codon:yes stop_codon:yes gene_type:complete